MLLNSNTSKEQIWQVKFSSLPTQHSTTSFVDDIYERLKGALAEYDVIISRWPEYTFILENVRTILLIWTSMHIRMLEAFNFSMLTLFFRLMRCFMYEKAIAEVEKAVVESLEKQYAEVLSPLKENTMPMKFGLKYVQKFAKGHGCPYITTSDVRWVFSVLMFSILHASRILSELL